MAVNRAELAAKLDWVAQNANPSDDEVTEGLADLMELLASKGLIDNETAVLVDELAEEHGVLLDKVCDEVAAQRGYAWRELEPPSED